MKKTKEFKKSQQGFLAIYATLVMLMLFFIVTAWGPMMSQMAVKNVEIEKSLGAEYLAAGELSRVAGYIKNNTMMSDRDILDKVSTKDDLKYYNLKVNDDDTDSDIDDFTFAIYTDPDLNYSSSEFVVTAIAKYNGTTKIMKKTIKKGTSSEMSPSEALLKTQDAVANIFADAIASGKFNGFSGNQLNSEIVDFNTEDNTLYEETNEAFINKLLGTTDYKTELGIDELYWHVNLGSRTEEDTVFYYLAENPTGNNSWRGWAVAIPTSEGFVYYQGLGTNLNGTVRQETGGLASVNNNTLEVFQTMLDASPLWEEVEM